jgi:hypothetical protein
VTSWATSDYIGERFVIKRRGNVQLLWWTVSRSSWAIVPYLIGIVAGSILGEIASTTFLETMATLALLSNDARMSFFGFGSFAIYLIAFFDLRFRTYAPSKRKLPKQPATQGEPHEENSVEPELPESEKPSL